MVPLATLPSKQGLKLARERDLKKRPFYSSCYTSIKTRIETDKSRREAFPQMASCYTSIKTRIETALPWRLPEVVLSSCYTSIKTRIETGKMFVGRGIWKFLLLHFHQNKD